MAVVKCNKCGADIPEKAGFCPACGAPKAEAEPVAKPAQPQPIVKSAQTQPVASAALATSKNASPMEGLFYMVFSKTAIILGIGIGILLLWIGVVIAIFASGSSDVAFLLSSMGFAAMGFLLLGGGIWNNKINVYTRLAMVLIGGFLIVNGISIMSLLTSSFTNLFSGFPGF